MSGKKGSKASAKPSADVATPPVVVAAAAVAAAPVIAPTPVVAAASVSTPPVVAAATTAAPAKNDKAGKSVGRPSTAAAAAAGGGSESKAAGKDKRSAETVTGIDVLSAAINQVLGNTIVQGIDQVDYETKSKAVLHQLFVAGAAETAPDGDQFNAIQAAASDIIKTNKVVAKTVDADYGRCASTGELTAIFIQKMKKRAKKNIVEFQFIVGAAAKEGLDKAAAEGTTAKGTKTEDQKKKDSKAKLLAAGNDETKAAGGAVAGGAKKGKTAAASASSWQPGSVAPADVIARQLVAVLSSSLPSNTDASRAALEARLLPLLNTFQNQAYAKGFVAASATPRK